MKLIGELGLEEFKKAERKSKQYKNWHSASGKRELKEIKKKYGKILETM